MPRSETSPTTERTLSVEKDLVCETPECRKNVVDIPKKRLFDDVDPDDEGSEEGSPDSKPLGKISPRKLDMDSHVVLACEVVDDETSRDSSGQKDNGRKEEGEISDAAPESHGD
jgi:hypothetical protein